MTLIHDTQTHEHIFFFVLITSPSGGGLSVGIVRSRTKATEFSLVYLIVKVYYILD